MRKVLVTVTHAVKRFICKCFGHKKIRGSVGTVGVKACVRCRRITDQITHRREVTRGDIERNFKAALPIGWRVKKINWKKGMIHVTDPSGNLHSKALPPNV